MKKLLEIYKKFDKRTIVLTGVLIVVTLVMYSLNPEKFGSVNNFKSIAAQLAEYGCFATAYFIVHICGGFNFACVMIGNLSTIVMTLVYNNANLAATMSQGTLLVISILVALITGMACGAFMSFFIAKFRLSVLIVTICAGRLFEGVGTFITGGSPAIGPASILQFSRLYLFDTIPVMFVVTVFCFLLSSIYLKHTRMGFQARLYGMNKTANRYSGISNTKTLLVAYMVSGFLSALGGLVVLARNGAAKSDYGSTMATTIILIVLLSGIILGGGESKILPVFISALILQVFDVGLMLGNSNLFLGDFLQGIVLLLVVIYTTKAYKELKIFKPRKHRSTPLEKS